MSVRQQNIAVLGCGLIGASWTALFLAHGYDVTAWDPRPESLGSLRSKLSLPLGQLSEMGRCSRKHGRLTISPDIAEAVGDAAWIQENAPEDVHLKHDLYRKVEATARDDAVIASSTSSHTWSELSTMLARKERLITAHPFNPPHLLPLVEIYAADPGVRERAVAFYKSIGKVPVVLKKDVVGHIANRLASALWREAVHLVSEDIADVADIDAALVNGPGLRWSVVGAHMAYHLGGGEGGIGHYLRHLGPSQERRWTTLGSPALRPDVCEKIVSGIGVEAAGLSISELEARRDRALIAALRSREQSDAGE